MKLVQPKRSVRCRWEFSERSSRSTSVRTPMPPPKARAILDFLGRFDGPLTADFQSFYGTRLATVGSEWTTGEIFDLIVWLPEGSAFRASLEAQGDVNRMYELYGWNRQNDQLLDLSNLTVMHSWMFASAH